MKIKLESWAPRTGTTVAAFAAECRNMTDKRKAEHRFAEFLVHNFGTATEHDAFVRGHTAENAARELLQYDRLSPHAWNAGIKWPEPTPLTLAEVQGNFFLLRAFTEPPIQTL